MKESLSLCIEQGVQEQGVVCLLSGPENSSCPVEPALAFSAGFQILNASV